MKAEGKNDLAERTKAFALAVIRMTGDLQLNSAGKTSPAFRDLDRS